MKLSLPFREKSLYVSTDKRVKVGIVLPHLSLCLSEVREGTNKEFGFPFSVWWGLLRQGKRKSFYQERQVVAVLVTVGIYFIECW